ncbi:MAG: hydrogenase maturation protease [Bacteroidetes bacterium]|nr:hydrogenase maturation protease [Bacteroidota bacterium]
MSKVLVIGYGNTLRGDDAAGIRAAELVSKRFSEIECVLVHQLVPELAEQISECDIVFFIDADVDIIHPEIRLIEPGIEESQPRAHFISPKSLLQLSCKLYQRTPQKTYIVGIPASQFEFSEKLSKNTEKAVAESVSLVEAVMLSDKLV